MYKGIYAEKKTFSKFDNEHYLCYLNEQREEYSPEPDARSGKVTEPVSAPILKRERLLMTNLFPG